VRWGSALGSILFETVQALLSYKFMEVQAMCFLCCSSQTYMVSDCPLSSFASFCCCFLDATCCHLPVVSSAGTCCLPCPSLCPSLCPSPQRPPAMMHRDLRAPTCCLARRGWPRLLMWACALPGEGPGHGLTGDHPLWAAPEGATAASEWLEVQEPDQGVPCPL